MRRFIVLFFFALFACGPHEPVEERQAHTQTHECYHNAENNLRGLQGEVLS